MTSAASRREQRPLWAMYLFRGISSGPVRAGSGAPVRRPGDFILGGGAGVPASSFLGAGFIAFGFGASGAAFRTTGFRSIVFRSVVFRTAGFRSVVFRFGSPVCDPGPSLLPLA